MATDESLSDAYDPSLVTLLLGEAAWLLRHLGFSAQHTIVIGGWFRACSFSTRLLSPTLEPVISTCA
ncbi:MAG: hypothetical protein M3510_07460 [Actinomycetota bacterium]|nr:hypothetical protein [Actinomycetota bacterium]